MRADGEDGSRACEHAQLGVVVVGVQQGEAFKVCIAKDKCKIHWGADIRAREKRRKAAGSPDAQKAKDFHAREMAKRDAEQKRIEAERERWKKIVPALAEAVAGAVNKAPAKAKGLLAQVVLGSTRRYGARAADANKYVPLGTTAEDLVRHAAFSILYRDLADSYWGPRNFPKRAKALGIDVKKLLDEHAPVEKEKPAAKAGKKGK